MTTYAVDIVVNGRDNASATLGRVGGALGSIATIAGGILTSQLFNLIGQQIMNMGKQAFEATASWERMGMAMQTMVAREMMHKDATLSMADALGKAGDKAQELLGWIQNLAIQSPFDTESIALSYRQFLTYGFGSDQAQELTQVLVDMAAGSGLSADAMNRVSYALGQINNTGKVLTLDLRQLMNAGVPVNDILKAMGKDLDDVSAGYVESSKFLETFTDLMGKDFAGAALRQATSWSGLANSMADIKKIGLREFFSSTFSVIQPLVENFVMKFSDPAFIDNLRKMGEPLGKVVKQAIDLITTLKGFKFEGMKTIFAGIDTMLPPQLADSVKGVFTSLQKFFVEQGPSLVQSGERIFTALFEGLKSLGRDIMPFVVEALDRFSMWITQNGPLIAQVGGQIADFFMNYVRPAIANLWMILGPLLTGITTILTTVASAVLQLATGNWKAAWNLINMAVDVAIATVKNVIFGAVNWILSFFGTNMAEMTAVWENNWKMLAQIVEKIKLIIISKVAEFIKIGKQVVDGIKQGIVSAWSNIINTLSGLLGELITSVLTTLGISSPSKVFADIGTNMVLGMAKGIADSASSVQAAMSGVLAGSMQPAPAFASVNSGSGLAGVYGAGMTVNNYGVITAGQGTSFQKDILWETRRKY